MEPRHSINPHSPSAGGLDKSHIDEDTLIRDITNGLRLITYTQSRQYREVHALIIWCEEDDLAVVEEVDSLQQKL